jgi:hypothetical protein
MYMPPACRATVLCQLSVRPICDKAHCKALRSILSSGMIWYLVGMVYVMFQIAKILKDILNLLPLQDMTPDFFRGASGL